MINLRWIILFLSCFLLLGNFYSYDLPASLNVPLQTYFNETDAIYQYEINTFYSVYSIPNVILPFFGGYLIDVFGSSRLTIILSLLVVIGQVFFAWGVTVRNFFLMYLGRMIFGMGGETLFVAQTRMTTRWFKGKELAFAMGVNLAMARVGSVLNDFLTPILGLKYSIPIAMWFGTFTCVVSFACSAGIISPIPIVLGYLDERYEPDSTTEYFSMGIVEDEFGLEEEDDTYFADILNESSEHIAAKIHHNTGGDINLKSMLTFPTSFWVLQTIMILMYATVIPFNTIHSAFLQTKWYKGFPIEAAQVMAIPDTISAILVPFCGHRTKILIVCGLMMAGVHFVLGTATVESLSSPMPSLIVLGFAYTLLLTFYPCISLVVEERNLATAYGLATATSNLSWVIIPVIVAALTNADPTYYLTEMFFCFCNLLGVAGCVWVYRLNISEHGGILELPEIKHRR